MGEEKKHEEKLFYLLEGAFHRLPKCHVKLRSYLMVHASQVADKYNLSLPKFFSSKNISCPFCFTSWDQKLSSFKLLPSTGKQFKSQTQSDLEKEKCCTRNKLVLKCLVCLRKSKFSLVKPEKKKDEIPEVVTASVVKNKRRKKKKCANLNVKACLDAGFKLKKNKEKNKKNARNSTSFSNNTSTSNQFCDSKEKTSVSLFKNPYATDSEKSGVKKKIGMDKLKERNQQAKNKFSNERQNIHQQAKKKKNQLKALRKALKEKKPLEKSSIKDFLNVISR